MEVYTRQLSWILSSPLMNPAQSGLNAGPASGEQRPLALVTVLELPWRQLSWLRLFLADALSWTRTQELLHCGQFRQSACWIFPGLRSLTRL